MVRSGKVDDELAELEDGVIGWLAGWVEFEVVAAFDKNLISTELAEASSAFCRSSLNTVFSPEYLASTLSISARWFTSTASSGTPSRASAKSAIPRNWPVEAMPVRRRIEVLGS